MGKELFEKANISKMFRFAGGAAQAIKSPYLLSGLIKCSHCGFNYSGYTRRDKNLHYYADSGYISKGSSVCRWHTIPKDELESFAIETIQHQIIDSTVVERFERLVEDHLSNQSGNGGTQVNRIEALVQQNAQKMRNLLDAVEKGVGLETILPRIKELEDEREKLQREIESNKKTTMCAREIKSASEEAAKFLLNFREVFGKAPVLQQKIMVRQIVLGIVVDREQGLIHCRMTRFPRMQNSLIDASLREDLHNQSKVCPEPDRVPSANGTSHAAPSNVVALWTTA